MFPILSCNCLCLIHWSEVLSQEWICSGSSADRQCSNYIWVINNFIDYYVVAYIRGLTVNQPNHILQPSVSHKNALVVRLNMVSWLFSSLNINWRDDPENPEANQATSQEPQPVCYKSIIVVLTLHLLKYFDFFLSYLHIDIDLMLDIDIYLWPLIKVTVLWL